jgi:hypothetical protein
MNLRNAAAVLSLALSCSCFAVAQSTTPDVEQLKAQLAAQQAQIERLGRILEDQQKLLEKLQPASATTSVPTPSSVFKNYGDVASTSPSFPAPAPAPSSLGTNPLGTLPSRSQAGGGASGGNPCERSTEGSPFLRIGNTCLTPVGFMDLTFIGRDKAPGSSLGTSFGSIPFNTNTSATSQLSEARFSPQNSRIGFRFDGDYKGARFIGYNEFDFLGTSGSTSITTSNGAFVPRLRLFWVDVRKGDWEVLGGQSWSMLTPNRKGISALPGDLFYSQVIDVNYVAGLTWTRQPGVRVLYHAAQDKVTLGVSLENPNQYIGGSAGGSGITLPTALASLTGAGSNQLDSSPNIGVNNPANAAPSVFPDTIVKLAIDPSPKFHFDVAGIVREFKIYNTNTTGLGALQHNSLTGGGLQFGFNAELFKGLRFISTNYLSDGGGRYIFGQAPDLVVHADGSLSGVHADGTVDGFEYTHKNWLFYGYYGGIYIGRNALLDANGTSRIGYGYTGSPNSQNRAINEVTFGFNQTIWKDAKYGAINLMGQYQYVDRMPWYVNYGAGAAKAAHDNTVYINLRYSLPGGAPTIR